jgi:amidase
MPLHDPVHAFMPYPDVPVPHAATGPLAGLRFGVKDLFDVAGYPTSGGQPLLLAMSGTKTRNAPTVQRLLDAGAAFGGKTLTDELAFSMNGNNAHFGAPVNGAAPERITGGSSCGSASAVSTKLVDFALGTDTGGSVRAPANHCGLYGLRPTHGRISLEACLDLSPSFDTCGWFARELVTFARVGEVLLGTDPKPLPARVRLLAPEEPWSLVLPEAASAFAALRERVQGALGAAAPCRALLDAPLEEESDSAIDSAIDAMYWHYRHVQGHEAWMTDGAFIERFAPPLGPGVAERFAWARKITEAQVAAGTTYRARLREHVHALLGDDGVFVMPTMPDIAPLRAASDTALEDYRNRALRMLSIAGLAGLPQLSLPLGTRHGAPLGLSLVGPPGSDASLIRLAARIVAAAAG